MLENELEVAGSDISLYSQHLKDKRMAEDSQIQSHPGLRETLPQNKTRQIKHTTPHQMC